MAEIIDLTVSPQPEIIEISSEEGTSFGRHNRTRENRKRKGKRGKTFNSLSSNGISGSVQPSGDHPLETGSKSSVVNESIPHGSATGEPGVFCIDDAAAPIAVDNSPPPPEPVESHRDGNQLLLPSHVTIFCDSGPAPAEVIPPPKPSSDDEEYIEYLDYEDRKAPGLIRYFEVEGAESSPARPSIFKCKNCGAEGDHKTYDCPIQICLTCGARDEHSTRSCPISKTCYTCGMKGHINKTCPNRFSTYAVSSDFHGDCDRCGSREHNINECPTLWRIYQYVNDEERLLIVQSRKQKERLAIDGGGEGYIGRDVWCYNCANTGHLGDDCDELPHPANFPAGYSAFSSHNVMSGPFYDPATEPVYIKRGPRDREGGIDQPCLPGEWDADALVDVGKRGKNKDKERLEKRFREQEDEGEDWFNDIRNVKRGMASSPGRGRKLKFGSFKDGGFERSPPPSSLSTSGSGSSLLARLGDAPGRNRPNQFDNPIRIRGAATETRNQAGRNTNMHKTEWGQDKLGGHRGTRRDQGPRYRGGYER